MNNKLINEDENIKATIGYGYLKQIIGSSAESVAQFIADGISNDVLHKLTSMSKTFGIVTDKRVYCFGKTYESINGKIKSTKGRKVIDIEDITGTSIVKARNIWVLLMGIPFILASAIYTAVTIFMYRRGIDIFSASVITVLISAAVILLYKMLRTNYISIEYAGGGIRLQTYMESEASIENFQNTIIQLKDKTKGDKLTNKIDVRVNDKKDTLEELKEAQQMLQNGLITEEDYSKLKNKILGI